MELGVSYLYVQVRLNKFVIALVDFIAQEELRECHYYAKVKPNFEDYIFLKYLQYFKSLSM